MWESLNGYRLGEPPYPDSGCRVQSDKSKIRKACEHIDSRTKAFFHRIDQRLALWRLSRHLVHIAVIAKSFPSEDVHRIFFVSDEHDMAARGSQYVCGMFCELADEDKEIAVRFNEWSVARVRLPIARERTEDNGFRASDKFTQLGIMFGCWSMVRMFRHRQVLYLWL